MIDIANPYGLSTGWDPATRTDFAAAVSNAAVFSTGAVELSALSAENLPALQSYLAVGAVALDAFAHVSIHGPAKHLPGDSAGWQQLVAELGELPTWPLVMHPDTCLPWLDLLAPLGDRLLFENMDCRKQNCRTADEIVPVFEALPRARFCLDVAHIWTIDPTLAGGHELLDRFGDRLAEIHLSGIEPNGEHRLTTPADLELYRPLLQRCPGVPVIFESPLQPR